MDKFLAIIIGCPLAFLILRYRRPIKDFTGDIAFAEKIFGMGGTNTFMIVFAIMIFVGSVMYAAGTFQGFLQSTLGKLF